MRSDSETPATDRCFVTGYEAIARGALRAGCTFFSTRPGKATAPLLSLFDRVPVPDRPTVARAEDDMAAAGQCIGAAMTGAKAMALVSGVGLGTCSGQIGVAQIGEVPLVIVDAQGLGLLGTHDRACADGDVLLARGTAPGGMPLPVFIAAGAESAYRLTFEAFNTAERLRTPIILLIAAELATRRQAVDLEAVELGWVEQRRRVARDDSATTTLGTHVPPFAPIGGQRRVRFTAAIHGAHGQTTHDPAETHRHLSRLREKISAKARQLEHADHDPDPDATTLLVSYGLSHDSAATAVSQLRNRGARVAHLTLLSLWPVPVHAIRKAISPRVERIVAVEHNIGLYADELRKVAPNIRVESVTRFDSDVIDPETVLRAVLLSPCG